MWQKKIAQDMTPRSGGREKEVNRERKRGGEGKKKRGRERERAFTSRVFSSPSQSINPKAKP